MSELDQRNERLIQAVKQMHEPSCPKCHYEPLEFACNVCRTAAGHLIAVIWCGQCGHTLNVQFIGMDAPQIQKPQLLVRPA